MWIRPQTVDQSPECFAELFAAHCGSGLALQRQRSRRPWEAALMPITVCRGMAQFVCQYRRCLEGVINTGDTEISCVWSSLALGDQCSPILRALSERPFLLGNPHVTLMRAGSG